MTQFEKAIRFQALHQREKAFAIPNPWDAGTARILSSLGFEALATTSAGLAFSLGRRDAEGALTRDEVLANAKLIVDATDLPVAADLENGFGDQPAVVAETIRLAAACGLVGGSIEDATGKKEQPIYDFSLAVERIAAAAESAHRLPFPFVLVARAENFLNGKQDLDDTIKRLQAYEAAGADVLFAPGLPDAEAIRTVCAAVTKPVNVVMGLRGQHYTMKQLTDLGVKRVSLGSSLSPAALSGLINAAKEIMDEGTFSFANNTISFDAVNAFMKGSAD
ncbi:isocitrate lyase/phosphoenolpyruvate mutase family protein [Leeia sp. TBRC 13508]|uniref:Isocitrate lyase/phosphoenolpyruvate mutase family protein n=1 Tax=Leeia speluncae TaxID=2884804 RepID=A0ABS8D7U6_9NEIS|nr:isocitrate lyase/phosphoenolpyruvate mutase family protein [Leeia speluncae]MCB6184202.1 isocitrate lyase/phosphoenolpyruvate mutase family protein [Leeia speluncae]